MSYMFVKVSCAAVLASALVSDMIFNFVPLIGTSVVQSKATFVFTPG